MKKLTLVLGLLVLLGSTGIASAAVVCVSGPNVTAAIAFPGMRLVFGRPNVYCWYQGRYYSRTDWDHFYRFHRDRVAYDRFHRDNDRRFDRDHGRF
jgi:hypothetical protein